MVGGARPVPGVELGQQVHHAGVDRQARPPARLPVARPEVEARAERPGRGLTAFEEPDDRLGQDQGDVALEAVPQPPLSVGRRVFPRRRVHPHLAVASLRGEGADVVGPEVEGAAGGQVEAGVVPVTGQDAVLEGAPVQGEAHVGAAVVDGMDLIAPGEECQGVSLDVDGQAACGLDVCQAANANEVSASAVFLGHDRFSLPPEAEAVVALLIDDTICPGPLKYRHIDLTHEALKHGLWALGIKAIEAMLADSKWMSGWTSPETKRESLNEPTIGDQPDDGHDRRQAGQGTADSAGGPPDHCTFAAASAQRDRSRSWRAKTRCVISSQRAFSSRESSAASFISFAT